MSIKIANPNLEEGFQSYRNRSCVRKVNYKSEETAIKAVAEMKEKGSKDLEPYACPFCDGWHIGREMSREELKERIAWLVYVIISKNIMQ